MQKRNRKKAFGKSECAKPQKPYPGFPLNPHASGKWQKKIRGKCHYFGKWGRVVDGVMERIPGDGWEEALTIYKAQAEALHSGKTPRPTSDGFTVMDLCNFFLTSKQSLVDSGELSSRTFAEYRKTTDRMIAKFGKNRLIDDLAADDFERLRSDIAKIWGPIRLGNEVQRVRTVFKYGYECGHMDKPMRFGPNFKKPSRSVLRKHRATSESRMFEAHEIRTLLASASVQLKAMILLGVNCGLGNSDCASLPIRAVDLDRGWIKFPRPKTGIDRRCPLWPETVKALRAALAERPMHDDPKDAGILFITKFGKRWVRTEGEKKTPINSIGLQFGKILKSVKICREGVAFYALRHTFRTIADATRDFPAVRLIMGHADDSIDDVYREHIDNDRLQAVTNHVRQWLNLDVPGVKKSKKGGAV